MTNSNSKADRFKSLLDRYPSEAKLLLYRNACLGIAATTLLILLAIFRSEEQSIALSLVKIGGAISMPIWCTKAILIEHYIWIGQRSYQHYRNAETSKFFDILFWIGGVGFLVSIGGFLYESSVVTLIAFVASLILCVVLIVRHQKALAGTLFDDTSE